MFRAFLQPLPKRTAKIGCWLGFSQILCQQSDPAFSWICSPSRFEVVMRTKSDWWNFVWTASKNVTKDQNRTLDDVLLTYFLSRAPHTKSQKPSPTSLRSDTPYLRRNDFGISPLGSLFIDSPVGGINYQGGSWVVSKAVATSAWPKRNQAFKWSL